MRWHAVMDTRRWGPGERLVFEPYTKETFEETFRWIADRGIFADTGMGSCQYESSIATAARESASADAMDQLLAALAATIAARSRSAARPSRSRSPPPAG